ncbi:hypothetical protein BFP70_06225 [Thioclava sp. SK-1]|uniref:FliH/SctL family protein n=1 Tax=Thioclava sp. SK-1 TaxID=1889770 RepID=UPI00082510FA|nr:hypothetical protein [Thioclava sp. SK-1]OCX66155.1 hypothetical protein BFP70_06225 [Thioclava sp. SK-1]
MKLESFDSPAHTPQRVNLGVAELEEVKLTAFEKGYSAGWEDAVAAQNAETARLHADLGQNLQAMSFTFQEARQHVLEAMKPLLVDMCAKVMPEIARASLPQMILEKITPIAEKLGDTPITVVVSPVSLAQVQETLTGQVALPLRFEAEDTLSEGQVYLRFGETETHIDMDGMIGLIAEAINGYFNIAPQEANHG